MSAFRRPARVALRRSLPFAALLLLALALTGAAAAAPRGAAIPVAPAPATPLPCGQGLWYEVAPSPANLVGAAAVALGGQVYVFGGDSVNYAPLAQKYDPAGDTWTALAPLPSGRTFASAVTDGAAIYILNGDTSSYGSAFLARYDPAANTYTALATPPHATSAQAAVYLNGRIYRIAGVTGFNETPVNTVDVYTIATNTWASAAAYPEAVGGLSAVAANGRIAAGGGLTAARQDTAKTYQYNPATNTWNDAALPDLAATAHYAATAVLHGRWIVAGGRQSGGVLPKAWALDLSNPAGGWTALPDMENGYPGPGGAATADAFYIVGGDLNQPRAAERYEENLCPTPGGSPSATPGGAPSATPCAAGAWDARAALPAGVQGGAAAAQGGRVYLFGGMGDAGVPSARAYVYTASANAWQALAPLPEARSYAGVVGDGAYLYILNGLGPNGAQQNTLWRYDPTTNSYTSLAPAPLATHGGAVALLGGRIYRVAGNGPGSIPTSTVDVYTIATNSWAPAGTVAPYPQAIAGLSAVGANGALWAAGGGFPQSAKTYLYEPDSNTWNDGAIRDLPAGRAMAAGGLLGARWLLAGGDLYTESPTSSVVAVDLNNPTGLWQNLAPLPHARRLAAGAVDGASLYALGGGPPPAADTQRYTDGGCGAPTATPTACPAGQFSDVHSSDYFYTPVQYLVSHGVVSGYADCTFRPYNNTTRAQMVKIVTLGFAIPLQTPPGGQYTFADAPPSQPFFAYIETAAAHAIVGGYTCGGPGEPCDAQNRPYFRPNANVTRGQLSKITVVAAGWPLVNPARPTFSDVAPGSAFYPFVETAVCHGIISGYADGTFRPAANATRGQIAKIEYLALTSPGSCGAPTPPPATATPTPPPAPPTDTPAPTATDTPAPTATDTPSPTATPGNPR